MGNLSDKEQEFKEFILKENKYSTDCHYMVYETYYKGNEETQKNEEVNMTSELDPMEYNSMELCGTTETNL